MDHPFAVLLIGITGALTAVRDALNTELGDVGEALDAIDMSYYISWPWEVSNPDYVMDGASCSKFKDGALIFQERSKGLDRIDGVGGERRGDKLRQYNTSKARSRRKALPGRTLPRGNLIVLNQVCTARHLSQVLLNNPYISETHTDFYRF